MDAAGRLIFQPPLRGDNTIPEGSEVKPPAPKCEKPGNRRAVSLGYLDVPGGVVGLPGMGAIPVGRHLAALVGQQQEVFRG